MAKTHFKVDGVDCRDIGQTEFEYTHQTACGYVRENVSRNGDDVDYKLCLKSEDMEHYHKINGTLSDSQGCI